MMGTSISDLQLGQNILEVCVNDRCVLLAGWDQIQTIESLLRKGGYKGQLTSDVYKSIRLTRYQSEKLAMSYNDYVCHKNPAVGAPGMHVPNGVVANGYHHDRHGGGGDMGGRYSSSNHRS